MKPRGISAPNLPAEVLTFDGHRDVAKIIDFGLGAIRRMEDVEEEWLSEVGKRRKPGLGKVFLGCPSRRKWMDQW